MKVRPPARTLSITVAAASFMALATLSACSSSSPSDATGAAASTDASFPVTIEHKFGTTTIESSSERIVTVGLTDQDAVLAMGTVPVATTNWFGDAPGRVFPWAEDLVGDADVPEVLDSEKEFEKVAALQPDLITAVYSGITEKDYNILSKIAPVVAAPADYSDYGTPWQEATVMIGTAMGKQVEAKAAVADVEEQLAQVREKHPEFKGKTAVTVAAYEGIFVYGPEDPRGRFLTDIGFTYPDHLKKFSEESFGQSISAENATMVDVDALVWVNGRQATLDMVPTYENLTASKEGRDIFIAEGDPLYVPSSFVTVLSLPYLIANEVPRLVAAVDGDTATSTDPS